MSLTHAKTLENDFIHQPFGRHVFAELATTFHEILDDGAFLEAALRSASAAGDVSVINVLTHVFEPSGVTCLVLLAESHVSLHTYPNMGIAFFDAFTCGNKANPERILSHFAASIPGAQVSSRHMLRDPLGLLQNNK